MSSDNTANVVNIYYDREQLYPVNVHYVVWNLDSEKFEDLPGSPVTFEKPGAYIYQENTDYILDADNLPNGITVPPNHTTTGIADLPSGKQVSIFGGEYHQGGVLPDQ